MWCLLHLSYLCSIRNRNFLLSEKNYTPNQSLQCHAVHLTAPNSRKVLIFLDLCVYRRSLGSRTLPVTSPNARGLQKPSVNSRGGGGGGGNQDTFFSLIVSQAIQSTKESHYIRKHPPKLRRWRTNSFKTKVKERKMRSLSRAVQRATWSFPKPMCTKGAFYPPLIWVALENNYCIISSHDVSPKEITVSTQIVLVPFPAHLVRLCKLFLRKSIAFRALGCQQCKYTIHCHYHRQTRLCS